MYLTLWIQQQFTWFPFMFDKSKHQGQRLRAWMCTAGRVYVHIYSLYLGQTCLLLSTQFIVSSLNISKHWKKTHNLNYFFLNQRHYIYKPGLVHVCLFLWNVWQTRLNFVPQKRVQITEFGQILVDEMIYWSLCKLLSKGVFSSPYIIWNISKSFFK